MKIRKSAWHYKLITKTWEGYSPKTLCGYFWIVCGTLLVWILLGSVGILISPFLLTGWGLYILWNEISTKRKIRNTFKEPKEPKDPSLVRAWISAKKQRVCPLIQIVE